MRPVLEALAAVAAGAERGSTPRRGVASEAVHSCIVAERIQSGPVRDSAFELKMVRS
jgi:hypothetical protein